MSYLKSYQNLVKQKPGPLKYTSADSIDPSNQIFVF